MTISAISCCNNERNCNEIKELNKGDVVFNSILEEQPQRLFTALHGGHWLCISLTILSRYPMIDKYQCLAKLKAIKCCRKSDIEHKGRKSVTTEDF